MLEHLNWTNERSIKMIESRSSILYKTWMDVYHSPAAERSRISYISYISARPGFVLRVVGDNGILISSEELTAEYNNVCRHLEYESRNVASSLRKYLGFVEWLLQLHLGGTSYGVVMEVLAGINCEDEPVREMIEDNQQNDRNYIESYSELFERFNINEGAFIEYGFSKTIFASADVALNRWHRLRYALVHNQPVYIRADSQGLWREFYMQVFENSHVYPDPDGNTKPIEVMSELTNYTTRPASFRECDVLKNYMLSHVFDSRTMNPLLFSNPCNFAFTPSFIDPFTGKAVGDFAVRYRREFRRRAFEKYRQIYNEYKDFVIEYNMMDRIEEFVCDGLTERQLRNFRRNARRNWDVEFMEE